MAVRFLLGIDRVEIWWDQVGGCCAVLFGADFRLGASVKLGERDSPAPFGKSSS